MSDLFDDCGLVLSNKGLAYGRKHGVLQWAPNWVKYFIVSVWNHITCFIYGHTGSLIADPGEKHPVCCNCCKTVTKYNEKDVMRLQFYD